MPLGDASGTCYYGLLWNATNLITQPYDKSSPLIYRPASS